MLSPGSTSMVAVWPAVVVPPSRSLQTRLVNAQPEGAALSVTVQLPGGTLPFFVLERVPSASSSRLKFPKQEPENEKSCGSLGTASFMIVTFPCPLVNVQVMVSPGSRSIVAVRVNTLVVVPPSGSAQLMEVRAHGISGIVSVHMYVPGLRLPKFCVLDSVPSVSSSSEKMPR